MTTYEGVPSMSTYLTMKLTNRVSRAKARDRAQITTNPVRTFVQATVSIVLHLAGFGALTFAGFTWNMTAGLIVAGMSCFVLAWLMNSSTNVTAPEKPGVDPMATRR